jgi:hypothetical protein
MNEPTQCIAISYFATSLLLVASPGAQKSGREMTQDVVGGTVDAAAIGLGCVIPWKTTTSQRRSTKSAATME